MIRKVLHALRRWGWPGMLAVLVLMLSGGVVYATRVMQERTAEAQHHIDGLEARLRQELIAPQRPSSNRDDWFASIPEASQRQQRLADLLEISIHQGLNVTHTEHRLSSDAASGLERVRVSMPLQGSYTQIRSFIGAALQHDPALSLDSLQLRRANPQATVMDAELVWSLHSRKAKEAA